jgi:hypothetical protein
MAYYRVCPDCGCNLDPGETCDCRGRAARQQKFFDRHLKVEKKAGQLAFVFDNREVGYAGKNYN